MAPSTKATDSRRKSSGKPTLIVNLPVEPSKLREILQIDDSPAPDSEDVKQSSSPDSTPAASTQPAPAATANGESASDSNAATPQAEGTPAPGSMGPPADGPKKKGVKRSAANANGTPDGAPKQKGKPGPKKKPRLEDGTIDHSSAAKAAAHKLGPKANQGAINAGLRALDRSGKPCRRWARGSFKLKTFTGVQWEIPRWTAPPKKQPESGADDSTAAPSADNSSGKENKENAQEGNSAGNSNSGGDGEMQSAPSIHASSPAPMAVTAAS